jgi:hypothetical protein
VAIAIENALAISRDRRIKNKLAEEKVYLEDEIRTGAVAHRAKIFITHGSA